MASSRNQAFFFYFMSVLYQRGEVYDGRGGGIDLQGVVAEGLGRVGRLVADVIAEQRAVPQIRRRRLKEERERETLNHAGP